MDAAATAAARKVGNAAAMAVESLEDALETVAHVVAVSEDAAQITTKT